MISSWELAKAYARRAKKAGMRLREYIADEKRRFAEDREREEREAFERKAQGSGIPSGVLREARSPGSLKTDAMLAIEDERRMLVLQGKPGVGKSVAACVWLLRGKSWRWISAGDLSRGYAYDAERFDALARVDRLVIDDLGVEYLDEKGRYLATLDELLDKRQSNLRPTLMTTNCSAADFRERYKGRIASRVWDEGECGFFVCGGEDLRRKRLPSAGSGT